MSHASQSVAHPLAPAGSAALDKLTVFTLLWACQALVHQEFYSKWLSERNPLGWALTIVAVAALLYPRSTALLAALAAASIAYNVEKWPFVVNHILMESIVNLTILGAVAWEFLFRGDPSAGEDRRDRAFDRFAPVVAGMLIVMYYFAFLAKLNTDFFDLEVSCVGVMYKDLVQRLPFLPTGPGAVTASIWATLVVEGAIPILLTFRRTRPWAIAIGLPFHFVLGLIGHRTFSALAYALYSLFLIAPLTQVAGNTIQRMKTLLGAPGWERLLTSTRWIVVLGVALLIFADLSGIYQAGVGPLLIFRIAWVLWIAWSLCVATFYAFAILHQRSAPPTASAATVGARPGALWLLLGLVFLNGMSQYVGMKTETCFTMYSNLRTEGGVNNHLFMPVLRWANYQDDLVEILDTDDAALHEYIDNGQLITLFELKRAVSESTHDLFVVYRRNGDQHSFTRKQGVNSDERLATKHPLWVAKVLSFRPVDKGEKVCCRH